MAKWHKWLNRTMWLLGAVVGVGIGGLFINGTFQNAVILNILPAVVHTVVGWALIAGSVLTAAIKLPK
jgi:hypothetical protein